MRIIDILIYKNYKPINKNLWHRINKFYTVVLGRTGLSQEQTNINLLIVYDRWRKSRLS